MATTAPKKVVQLGTLFAEDTDDTPWLSGDDKERAIEQHTPFYVQDVQVKTGPGQDGKPRRYWQIKARFDQSVFRFSQDCADWRDPEMQALADMLHQAGEGAEAGPLCLYRPEGKRVQLIRQVDETTGLPF